MSVVRFMWQSHYEGSPRSSDECRTLLIGCWLWDQAYQHDTSSLIGCWLSDQAYQHDTSSLIGCWLSDQAYQHDASSLIGCWLSDQAYQFDTSSMCLSHVQDLLHHVFSCWYKKDFVIKQKLWITFTLQQLPAKTETLCQIASHNTMAVPMQETKMYVKVHITLMQ